MAGLTMELWANANDTTQGYVSNLLAGRRSNDALERKIERFTERHLKNIEAA
jgi:hypothetical protein